MSPARYAALRSASLQLADRRRKRAASSGGTGSAHFASYVGSARSARSHARDRHLHRQSRLREAAAATEQQAAQQHRQQSGGRSSSEAEAAASIMAAAAEALEAARAEDAQRSLLLGRSSSAASSSSAAASASPALRGHDSDSEDEDSAAAERREAAEEAQAEELDRRYAQSRGPRCERACFPALCYRCCPTPLTDCCTVRRGVCVSVWSLLVLSATLFALYYCLVVSAHGWRWPPHASSDND